MATGGHVWHAKIALTLQQAVELNIDASLIIVIEKKLSYRRETARELLN